VHVYPIYMWHTNVYIWNSRETMWLLHMYTYVCHFCTCILSYIRGSSNRIMTDSYVLFHDCFICIHLYVTCVRVSYGVALFSRIDTIIRFFAKEPYKTDDILQKRPIILSILLTVATPYLIYVAHPTVSWLIHMYCFTTVSYVYICMPHVRVCPMGGGYD